MSASAIARVRKKHARASVGVMMAREMKRQRRLGGRMVVVEFGKLRLALF